MLPAVIIGAGPAGLATSYELQRRGIGHVVLERGATGESWSHLYDSLTLHTGKHMSALPGLRFHRRAPLFLPKEAFLEYLRTYADRFGLPVAPGHDVRGVTLHDRIWRIETSRGILSSRALVVATGIISSPFLPHLPGESEFGGVIRHSSTYRNPAECRGRRILVVGCGNSAGEIATELGRAGVDTTVSVRSGTHVVPLHILGVPIQYVSHLTGRLPRRIQLALSGAMNGVTDRIKGRLPFPRPAHSALDEIPMIGFRLIDAIRDGVVKVRRGITRLTRSAVVFDSGDEQMFDEIILATGFRPALSFLPGLNVDDRGFAARSDRVTSRDYPQLYFVGHTYDTTGALFNIARDARLAAAGVARDLQ